MALTKKDVSDLFDEKLEPIKNDIGDIKKDVSALKGDVSALKKDMGSVKKDISSLKINSVLIKKDVASVKTDLETVKNIVNREFINVNSRLDRLEDISLAVVEDHNDHDTRLKRLEKHTKISSSN